MGVASDGRLRIPASWACSVDSGRVTTTARPPSPRPGVGPHGGSDRRHFPVAGVFCARVGSRPRPPRLVPRRRRHPPRRAHLASRADAGHRRARARRLHPRDRGRSTDDEDAGTRHRPRRRRCDRAARDDRTCGPHHADGLRRALRGVGPIKSSLSDAQDTIQGWLKDAGMDTSDATDSASSGASSSPTPCSRGSRPESRISRTCSSSSPSRSSARSTS